MNTLSVFVVFSTAMFIALVVLWVMVTLIGPAATLAIFGGALLFGGGAAIIEYITTERS